MCCFLLSLPKTGGETASWTAFSDYSAKRQQPAEVSTAVNKQGSGQGDFPQRGETELRARQEFWRSPWNVLLW